MSNTIVTSEKVLEKLIQDAVRKVFTELQQKQKIVNNLLTIQEASDYLRIAVQTLYQYTSYREITFTKVGKKVYFSKEDLDAWLLERKCKSDKQVYKEGLVKQK